MREGNKGVCMCVRVRERVEMEGGESAYMRVCESVCGEKGGESGVSKCVVGRFRGVCVYVIPFCSFIFFAHRTYQHQARPGSFFPSLISPPSTSSKRTYAVSKKHPQPQTHRKKRNSRTPREENAEENRSIIYGFYTVFLFSFSFLLALGATYTYTQTK